MTQIIPSRWWGGWVGLYKYMWTVDYYEDLPSSWMKVWDTYNVVNAHTTAPEFPAWANLAWNGEEWDVLGWTFDLSEYQKKLVEWDGIDIDQDTNEISVESSIIEWAAAWATAVQPWDDVSTLTNDAWYIDNTVDNLTNYTKTSDLAAVALSNDYDDLDDKPTIWDATLTIQKNWTDVSSITMNATSDVTANISVPTDTSDLTNWAWFIDKTVDNLDNYTKTSDLAAVATSGSYTDLSNKPTIWTATLTIQKNGSNVQTFWANATSNVTANITVPTDTWDLTNGAWFIDKDVNDLTNYTPTSSLATVATSGSYSDLSNKPTIWTWVLTIQRNSTTVDTFSANATGNTTVDISVPTTVAELTDSSDYAKTANLATVATSWDYDDLLDKPTIWSGTLTIQKNSTTIDTFSANATSNKTINVTVPTKTSDLTNDSNFVASTSLATVATSWSYSDLSNKPTIPSVIDNLTSTSTTNALSANQGKVLKDMIDDLSALGKFLSLWDSTTWLPISFPQATPYTYSTWDYFLVETIWTTNYKPTWSSYTGTASTTVETEEVEVWDIYIYDGTSWLLQINHGKTVSFANLTGSPSDNAALDSALDAKQDVSNMVTTLTWADNDHYPTAKAVSDALSWAGNGDMLKSVYDPNNIEADVFDYDNFINTPNLATVATSWAYSDLSWTPTLAAVATSGSYTDLSNKPTIPTVNNATLTIQKNWTNVKTFTANASTDVTANITVPTKTSDLTNDSNFVASTALATVATSGSYNDLSNKPTIPTVNNATLTIQKNWTNVNTFTANASSNVTANITVPTTVAELSDSGDYVTSTDLSTTLADYVESTDLATVATSGSYADLTNKPTIWTATLTIQKNWTTVNTFGANATSNVTANITVPTKTSDLTNDSNYVASTSLATVATSGSYNDLSNKPTIPTVNNATLTIQKNGTNVNTFTANASSNVTANIQVNEVPSGWNNWDVLTNVSGTPTWSAPAAWWITNDTTWTTTTITALWGGTEQEYTDLWTHSWTVLYFTF